MTFQDITIDELVEFVTTNPKQTDFLAATIEMERNRLFKEDAAAAEPKWIRGQAELPELQTRRNWLNSSNYYNLDPAPALPEEFQCLIEEMAREGEATAARFETDVSGGHNPLWISMSQIADEFLTAEEREHLLFYEERRKKKFLEVTQPKRKREKFEISEPKGKRKRSNSSNYNNLDPAPALPEEFQRVIEELARERVTMAKAARLVIEKGLFKTDVSGGNNRLSIPRSQISNDFLTAEEREHQLLYEEGKKKFLEVTQPKRKREKSEIAEPKGKRKRSTSSNNNNLDPAAEAALPEEFQRVIEEMAREREATATAARLVIQKGLFETDVSGGHNRLSIPRSQIADDFLTAEEREHLSLYEEGKKKKFLEVTQPKRKREKSEIAETKGKRKRSNSSNYNNLDPSAAASLPEEFQRVIEEMAREREATATMARLVIQKGLFETDVSCGHNRLSIPRSKIADDFLTAEEREHLSLYEEGKKKKFLEVTIVQPSLAPETVKFSRWDMPKKGGGKTSTTYVINGNWNAIVERNKLRGGMVVQLWCFRIDRDLCFALVRLPMN